MRNSIVRIVVFCVAVVGGVGAIWVIPSYAQRTQGTLAQPGMTEARVWINNRTSDEAIPVTWIGGNPKTPVPVTVQGQTSVVATKQSSREYRSVSANADQDLSSVLNGLGSDGWEAVGMTLQPVANVTPPPVPKLTILLKRPR